jgi:hypothetical protein
MRRSSVLSHLFAVALLLAPALGWAADPTPATPAAAIAPAATVTKPEVLDLGGGRYRVGSIEVDKNARSFTVPGVLNLVEGPLEYIACVRQGMKAYETLVELDCNAYEFNVACLLIGLDPKKSAVPKRHFDPEPAKGDAVTLNIEWHDQGQTKRFPPEKLIKGGEAALAKGDWVYTGSTILEDGRYLAELMGPVIGFVHDPAPIIEHSIGAQSTGYGVLVPNAEVLPAKGTPMRLQVTAQPK